MRRMTTAEQRNLLKIMATEFFGTDMMLFDAICYGGQLEKYRDARDHIERCIKAIPNDIRKAYNNELNKEKADKLRAQADALENACN